MKISSNYIGIAVGGGLGALARLGVFSIIDETLLKVLVCNIAGTFIYALANGEKKQIKDESTAPYKDENGVYFVPLSALCVYHGAVYYADGDEIAVVYTDKNLKFTVGATEYMDKALDYARKALKLYPSSVDAYIIRGNSYIELGRYEKACRYRTSSCW